MLKKLEDLHRTFLFPWSSQPMMAGRLPGAILAELDGFVAECRRVRDSELGFMRVHKNAGNNSYQLSVPPGLLENSYSMAYFNHAGEFFMSAVSGGHIDTWRRRASFRRNYGHYDGYDFWVNFANVGDENPKHHHAGMLSAVVYIENDGLATNFENGISFAGERGDMLMFPASLGHWVDMKLGGPERVTMSFNLIDPGP